MSLQNIKGLGPAHKRIQVAADYQAPTHNRMSMGDASALQQNLPASSTYGLQGPSSGSGLSYFKPGSSLAEQGVLSKLPSIGRRKSI